MAFITLLITLAKSIEQWETVTTVSVVLVLPLAYVSDCRELRLFISRRAGTGRLLSHSVFTVPEKPKSHQRLGPRLKIILLREVKSPRK